VDNVGNITAGREYWQSLVDEFLAGEFKSKREYCRQNEIHYDNFLYWLRKLTNKPNQKVSKLVPIALPTAVSGHCVIDIAGGHRLTLQTQEALAYLPDVLCSIAGQK
tara:strand:- start:2004 stop:2324 length:321 start_codon:yes stop_codon:yes gene_type:complete